VLELGTGAGYQTAVLAYLSGEVYSVEKNGVLAEKAKQTLNNLGYYNVHVIRGDPLKGWSENSPYDVIIVNNAVYGIPPQLSSQLASDGRMILPIQEDGAYQTLTLVERVSGVIKSSYIDKVRFDPI